MASSRLSRHVLVTRPQDDAAGFATELTARGWQPVLAPLLTIRIKDEMAAALRDHLDQAVAVLVTSSNGVRALARLDPRRDRRLLAVGPVTALAARECGFTQVVTADGNVAALADMAAAVLQPADGPVLHIAGSVQAGDLSGALAGAGFTVRRLVLYESAAAKFLPKGTITALKTAQLAAVTLFSPRTAAIFVALIGAAGLASSCRTVAALCLSKAVAEEAKSLPWHRILISERSDAQALLDLLPAVDKGATES